LIALSWTFSLVDWRDVKEALYQADYRYLIPVIILYTLGLAARGVAWRLLLQSGSNYTQVFLTVNIGYLLNNLLPLRLGEFGRAFLLGRHGLGFWRVLSTILVERSFDMIVIAGMLLGSLPFMFGMFQTYQLVLIILLMVSFGLFILHLLASREQIVYKYLEKIDSRVPGLYIFLKDKLQAFLLGLKALTKPWDFLRVFGWMMMTWIFALVAQFLLLKAFLPHASFIWIVFGQGLVALGAAAPSSPAYVGVIEAAWVGALTTFGIQSSTALAYAISSHLLNIVVTGVIGGYGLVREGDSISELYRQLREKIR
jgi:uncharacterized protein (TIRG00374 family)